MWKWAANRPFVNPSYGSLMYMEHRWNEIDRGHPKNSDNKNIIPTTYPIWTDLSVSLDLRGKKPALTAAMMADGK